MNYWKSCEQDAEMSLLLKQYLFYSKLLDRFSRAYACKCLPESPIPATQISASACEHSLINTTLVHTLVPY